MVLRYYKRNNGDIMYVEKTNILMNELDISGDDATEIINIYFEFFEDMCSFSQFLIDNVRIIREKEENWALIAELETIDDVCLFKGDDYYMLTNYKSLVEYGDIGDCLPSPF